MTKKIKTDKGVVSITVRPHHVSFTVHKDGAKAFQLGYSQTGLEVGKKSQPSLPEDIFGLIRSIRRKIKTDKIALDLGQPSPIPVKNGIATVVNKDNSQTITVRRDGQHNVYLNTRLHCFYDDFTDHDSKAARAALNAIESVL